MITFTAFTQNILNAIGIAERSCGKSLQLPIVNYVLFYIEKNKLRISATNLEQGVIVEVLGKSDNHGKIAVPARIVGELLRNTKNEKVTLLIEGTTLKIEADGRRAVIQGLNGDEFPIIPKLEKPVLFEIPAAKFGRVLDAVSVAASHSDIRPELTGVYFAWNTNPIESKLTIAATDSFRLAEYNFSKEDLDVKYKDQIGSCILPMRAVQELTRIAGETEGDLAFAFNETQFGALWGNGEFVSRLLEGSFPNYRTIVPQTFKTKLTCHRRTLIDLIRQAGLFSSKINDVKLSINSKSDELRISSRDVSKGEYEASIDASISGEDIVVAFNYQFLIDGLEHIETDEVMLGLNDPNSPVLMRPNEERAAYSYIAMPLRV